MITLISCVTLFEETKTYPSHFCLLYEPVYTSVNDTEETIKQVVKNNAIWLEFCEHKKD